MAVNLKDPPYYDDYDENKNFQKILFKPGVSVQSRELNQFQSILKTDIQRTADGIYGDGGRISNEPSSFTILDDQRNQIIRSVKLTGTGANVASYVGKYITGATSNTIGLVRFAYEQNDPLLGDPTTLVISVESAKEKIEYSSGESVRVYNNFTDAYQKNNNIAASETTVDDIIIYGTAVASAYDDELSLITISGTLAVGDELVLPRPYRQGLVITKIISSTTIRLNFAIGDDLSDAVTLAFYRKNTCPSSIVNVSSGTYYKNGSYTKIQSQSIVPDKYTNTPSKSIVLKLSQDIVTYNEDDTLLDPAFESSNYLAPGADRLRTTLTLQSIDLDSNNLPNTTDDIIEVARFIEGRLDVVENAKNTLPVYLNNILADRTYSESGNYEVSSFRLSPRGSSGGDTYAKFLISPGKAVVGGQLIETLGSTAINIPKAKTSDSVEDIFINANQDNYFVLDAPSFGFIDPNAIRLYDILEAHSTTDRSAMTSNTRIGYVSIKHLVYDSGEGSNTKYRTHWIWHLLDSSNTQIGFADAKSLISSNNFYSSTVGNDGTYANPKFFANVNVAKGLDSRGKLKTYDNGNRNKLLFPLENRFLKSISNIRIYYYKRFTNQTVTSSQASISLSGTEKFVGNSGSLSADDKRKYYQIIVKSTTIGTLAAGEPVNLDDVLMTLNENKDLLTINLNTLVNTGAIDLLITIYNSELPRKTKQLNVNVPSEPISIMRSEFPYSIAKSDIYSLKGIYSIGSNVFLRNYSSTSSYILNDHVTYNGVVYRSLASSTGQPISNQTYWEQLPKESNFYYSFNNGHYDTHYDHATVTFKGSLTDYNPGNVIVVTDYFTHSGSGVIDFTSYPTNIQNTIPNYRSPDGTVYNLRQTLDFRPRKNDSNVIANLWADNNSNTYVCPHPSLENALQIDYEYYKPRIDRLYLFNKNTSLSEQGFNFYLDSGIPDLNPKAPVNQSSKDKLLIGTLLIPPFTQNSSDIQIVYNKAPRYTMSDIQTIDQRLTNLEKRVKKQGLDIVALNNQIFAGGNTQTLLFKTGVLVDDFSSVTSNDIRSPSSTCTIDNLGRSLYPSLSAVNFGLVFANEPDLLVKNDIVTFKVLQEEPLISATKPTLVIESQGATANVTLINPNSGGVKSVGSGFISLNDISTLSTVVSLLTPFTATAQGGSAAIVVGGKLFDIAADVLTVVRSPTGFIEGLLGTGGAGEAVPILGEAAGGSGLGAFIGGAAASVGAAALSGSAALIELAAATEIGATLVVAAAEIGSAVYAGGTALLAAAASTCFTEDTFISMADGSTKKIKDVNIGDKVFNKDKTKINTVLYLEKTNDIKFDKLYSPNKKFKPFATMNHPLYIDGVLSCPDPEYNYKWYPWLGKNAKLEPASISSFEKMYVYNLWLDGDNTYIVNGYGTHSIVENVEFFVDNYTSGKLTNEEFTKVFRSFTDDEYLMHGAFLFLKAYKATGIRFILDLSCKILKDDSNPFLAKMTLNLTRIVGKIGKLLSKE